MRIGDVPPTPPIQSPGSPGYDQHLIDDLEFIYQRVKELYAACHADRPDIAHINELIKALKDKLDGFTASAEISYTDYGLISKEQYDSCVDRAADISHNLDLISTAMGKNPPDLKAVEESYQLIGDICLGLINLLGGTP